MINQLIRYESILKYMHCNDYTSLNILEVGSGTNGICKFINKTITGIDIDFKDYGVSCGKINPLLKPMFGDITKTLPFKKNEFDIVICVDVFEHLTKSKRQIALSEITRVGKLLYLSFPVGSSSKKMDAVLQEHISFMGLKIPIWLDEHLNMEFPVINEFRKYFSNLNLKVMRSGNNENLIVHYIVIILETIPFLRFLGELLSKTLILKHLTKYLSFGKTYRRFYYVQK